MAFVRRRRFLMIGFIFVSFASLLHFNWSSTHTFSFPSSATTEQVLVYSREALPLTKRKQPFVAIVACIRSLESWNSVNETSLYNAFLPSVWPSITDDERKAYRIEVVLAFDEGDTFWESPGNRTEILTGLPFAVSFISVPKDRPNHIPFNELCRAAYEYGADYIVRFNDDSHFNTSGWITKGVDALASFDPPNVGVIGPICRQGNTLILTHDMVHRTHLEIFDDYYPDEFDNWYVDTWISFVYGPNRTMELEDWEVNHLLNSHGTRYKRGKAQKVLLNKLVDRGAKQIEIFLAAGVKAEFTPALGTRRIAMVAGPMEVASSNRTKYGGDTNTIQLVEAT